VDAGGWNGDRGNADGALGVRNWGVCGVPSERGVGPVVYPERCSGLVYAVPLGHGVRGCSGGLEDGVRGVFHGIRGWWVEVFPAHAGAAEIAAVRAANRERVLPWTAEELSGKAKGK
jgi:hypothetical protein